MLGDRKMQLSNFPYFSQLDNAQNPSGSCNVTAIAMCLSYLGIRPYDRDQQLEDELYEKCTNNGWSRHDPLGLKRVAESYNGIKDSFTATGTLDNIRRALEAGMPCVIHGYFTRIGHIITVVGFDENGLIVNDPYGEWFESGYNTQVSGESLHYSYSMISRLCSPESVDSPRHIWLHRLSYQR
ncbi:MAG: C39 family peptidase [Microcoleus sp.]